MFALLGPVLGVLVAFSFAGKGHRDLYGVPLAYFFSLIVCAIVGPFDGVLARVARIGVRVPMIAIAGAVVAVGLYVFVVSWPPNLIPLAAIGAFITGACSLLASCSWRRSAPVAPIPPRWSMAATIDATGKCKMPWLTRPLGWPLYVAGAAALILGAGALQFQSGLLLLGGYLHPLSLIAAAFAVVGFSLLKLEGTMSDR